jgi:CHAT domain-containing protein/tetratricopeptide (TPR) repeat protein
MIAFKKITKTFLISTLIFPWAIKIHAITLENKSTTSNDSISYLINIAQKLTYSADYDAALFYLYKLYDLRSRTLNPNNVQIAYSLINIGGLYNMKNEQDSAIFMLNKAEKVLLSNPKPEIEELGNLYSLMGSLYSKKGEYTIGENYLLQAENLFIKNKSVASIEYLADLYLRYILLYSSTGRLEKARQFSQKEKKIIDKIPHKTVFNIYYYLRIANIEKLSGNIEKSIDYNKKELEISLKDSINNISAIFSIYENLGLSYLDLNKLKLSKNYFDLALKSEERYNYKGKVLSNLYTNIGNYYVKAGNLNQSLFYYQLALKALFTNFKPLSDLDNPKPDDIIPSLEALETLKDKADVLFKIYKRDHNQTVLDASINTSILAISVIENLRNSYQTYESKLAIAKSEDETFKTALEHANEAYIETKDKKYITPAFEISEKNKSSLLLSSLKELEAKNIGGIPENILAREKYLSKRIDFFKEQIYEEKQVPSPDSNKIVTWENYLFKAQNEHTKIIGQLEKNYPNYFALKYNYKTIDIKELQRKIPRKTSLIEYTLTDSLLCTFVISKRTIYFHTQKIDSSFYKLVNDYLSEYQNFDFSRQFYSRFTEFCLQSKELYNILIRPVASYIKDEKLIVVPDGIISYIPFETLIDTMPNSIPSGYFRDLSYMLNKYDISYTFSSTLFLQTINKRACHKISSLLAFAPQYFSTEINLENYRQYLTRQKYRKNLFPIPGAKEEVESIRKLIKSDVYEGMSATETNFKNIAGNYDILHLAMHTVIDNKDPLYSKLIFTLNNDSLNDGLLNTYEIFGLKLKARMVVLSACSTGNGEFSKGEGVISLARGFVYAGIPSLVMTLWEVEDKSGSVLMKDFYINLLKGQSKSAALRNAKIKFIREAKAENSHPFFWSSFVLMGNPDPLEYSIWPMIIFFSLLIITITCLTVIYTRRKKINPVGL